jgi:hypothetical protein
MRRFQLLVILSLSLAPATFAASGDVSVERGLQVSIVGSCHVCHTEGYSESGGKIDPEKAFKGRSVGYRGPWGTTYAWNIRINVQKQSEQEFVQFFKYFRSLPPMPWYALRVMDETDVRSLYQHIKSLGEPGEQIPALN